jgi:4-hydroxymandelate oxidase
MKFSDVLVNARQHLGPYCKGCNVCNGVVCKNSIPGPGAKGIGDNAIRNYMAWQKIRVHMDTLSQAQPISTEATLFGRTLRMPLFAGPVGAVTMHYSDLYNDATYNNILVSACKDAGIAAFTGDGVDPEVMKSATSVIFENEGVGVPTIKPWNQELVMEKLTLVKESGAFAVSMDIDAAGLPFLKNMQPPAGPKSVEALKILIEKAECPFIIKGIMTVKGALKAKEAGAAGIVVSNHGGRVLDQCPATAEVLMSIVDAVGKDMVVLVDGGIRTGVDVFKALAMGAHGVIIARPFVSAVYGGAKEGVQCLVDQLHNELIDTMIMCGVHSISEISREHIMLCDI